MKKIVSLILFICLFSITPSLGSSQGFEIQIAFAINLLSPNTSAARNQWSLLMEQQLPKIGIGITFHENTGWGNIGPRTWSYPLVDFDYIPTYAAGGYDMLFYSRTWDLDWDPTGFFDGNSVLPNGSNFYQYQNPIYDVTLDEYLNLTDSEELSEKAYQLQNILYEDLPSICLVYPRHLYVVSESVEGIDPLLISTSNHRAEFWSNSLKNTLRYALPVDFREPNIFVSRSTYDQIWMDAVYGSLFRRKQEERYWEPILAKNYTISPDSRTIIVDIDPNAKFSDNSSVLAEDIVYSYALHMNKELRSLETGLLSKVFHDNTSIEMVDFDTVEFNLKSPYPFLFKLLSFGIIDKSSVEPLIVSKGLSIFNEKPFSDIVNDTLVKSCGPFVLNNYDSVNSIVELIPNSYYNNLSSIENNAKLDSLIFEFISGRDNALSDLYAGDVDILDPHYYPLIPDFEDIDGIEGALLKVPAYEGIAINMKHPVLGTGELTPVGTAIAAKSIRKAISHAVPRQVIVDEILEGLGAPGITIHPDSLLTFDESLEPYAYDLDLSIDYMEDAGYDIVNTYGHYHTPIDIGLLIRNIILGIMGAGVVPIGIIVLLVKFNRTHRVYIDRISK